MRDLITVAFFTIKDMVKRKSFIISNIIIILIIVLLFNIPNLLKLLDNGEGSSNSKLLIVDSENIFEGNLEAINQMDLSYDAKISNEELSFDEIKEKISNNEIDAALVITPKDGKISMEYIVENLTYLEEIP